MIVNELKNKLDEIGVSQDLYSIMIGGLTKSWTKAF